MAQWQADPTFYPTARSAMAGPPEELAYVVTLNTGGRQGADALCVLDVAPGSATYSQVVGRVEMPRVGDELHHFGWNACSSALCPNAPHPHVERRYLIAPGIRSSRLYVIDTQPDPRQPRVVKTVEPAELMGKSGYSRPHTVHCGPDGVYISAFGNPAGHGPGGVGGRPGAAVPRVRLLVASGPRHYDHQRVGHPHDDRERGGARPAAGRPVRARA